MVQERKIPAGRETLVHSDSEVDAEAVRDRVRSIAAQLQSSEARQVCYVLGMGSQPRGTYASLLGEAGVEVVWESSVLPRGMRWLGFVVASEAGLVKVLDYRKLPEIFARISTLSMAGIYIFDESLERSFVEEVKRDPSPADYTFGLNQANDYFLYVVDADNSESSTGIYEILSFGFQAHVRL